MSTEYLVLKNITKEYPGVVALDDVSVDFRAAEIHALVGENGAGKSTLVKCISGAIEPNRGKIILEGKEYAAMDPAKAMANGIEIIYQELSLFSTMSVMENIFMSDLPGGKVMVDFEKMKEETEAVFTRMGIDIRPETLVRDLSSAQMQMVEIAKAITRKTRCLILDEPTAPLSNAEIDVLFRIIRSLKEEGLCIIYISHRLNEIFELTDRVTIMRDGKVIGTRNTADTDRQELISLMVGRTLSESFAGHQGPRGEVILQARHLQAPKVKDISFDLYRGEILGIGGLVGAGRSETVRLLFGADPLDSGQILINGEEAHIAHPSDAMRYKIALCPEDRKIEGVLQGMPIAFNLTLPIVKRISRAGVVSPQKDKEIVEQYKDALRIKTPSVQQLIRNLSGGNQQKVVIAKWLASGADILIFDEPTHGIDVGSKAEIYQLIFDLADQGKAIIVVSSEMEEIMGLCDRMIVLYEGEMMGELQRSEFTQERILDMASGHRIESDIYDER